MSKTLILIFGKRVFPACVYNSNTDEMATILRPAAEHLADRTLLTNNWTLGGTELGGILAATDLGVPARLFSK